MSPSPDVLSLTGLAPYNFRWNVEAPVGTTTVVTYSFPDRQAAYDTEARPGFQGMSPAHQVELRKALDTWSAAGGLTFVEVPEAVGGDITFSMFDMRGETTSSGQQISGYGYYPSYGWYTEGGSERSYFTVHDSIGGDIFLNSNSYASNAATLAPGRDGFSVVLHEIGHAIGFKHPFSGTPTIEHNHDNDAYTVMSYDRSSSNISLGSVDIEALRFIYGETARPAFWNAARSAVEQSGTDADEWLIGWDKNDIIHGGGGDDVIRGKDGDDELSDGAGNDTLEGQAGDDILVLQIGAGTASDNGNDSFDGGQGIDTLVLDTKAADLGTVVTASLESGLAGVQGGLADTFFDIEHLAVRGDADAVLTGGKQSNRLSGGGGDDALLGAAGFDTLTGGAGNDTATGGNGRDLAFLGQGDDLYLDNGQGGDLGRDTVFAGAGNDTIQGGNGNDVFRGEWGNDLVLGRLGHDLIEGGDGFDTVHGGGGDDSVAGGNGRDLVSLGEGDDLYLDNGQGGVLGRDTVYGNQGNDTIRGGNGDDLFLGGLGNDVIFARLGDDVLSGEDGFDTLDAGAGNDTVTGGNGRDLAFMGTGDDLYIDNGQGGIMGQDTVFAGAGDDRIQGGNGNDVFYGEIGDDLIFGRLGADTLTGGDGNDMLHGGAGADTFVFAAGEGLDVVKDYELGVDRLQLEAGIWSGGLSAAQVVGQFASSAGSAVLFDFGGGNSILLEGVASLNGLENDLIIL